MKINLKIDAKTGAKADANANTKTRHLLPVLVMLALLVAAPAQSQDHSARSVSKIFTLDQVYKSMFGPKHRDRFSLLDADKREVLWVTGIRADIVGSDGESPESPEYFCHSVLTQLPAKPKNRSETSRPPTKKMFTLVQGLTEIRFPEGFAMPVLSTDRFGSSVMVMNPIEREHPVEVGVDSRIQFLRQSELAKLDRKMKPLFLIPLVTKVAVEDPNAHHASHEHGGDETCLAVDADSEHSALASEPSVTSVGRPAGDAQRGTPISQSAGGVEKTGHWYVPPGRHVYRHRLDQIAKTLHVDARAHYIYAHLHPFGESLELLDLTTGQSVFKATAHNYPDRIAVEEISHYSSQEGVAIHRDHDYEIVATYDNTTSQDVDSMAVMYLYLSASN